jgi:putative membrane protein
MLWVKAFHIVFVVSWFAGLFYLPRLFVYHALAGDPVTKDTFKLMERKLYRGIMTPTMVLALLTGGWMWLGYGVTGGWLHAKMALVVALVAYHAWLGHLLKQFAADQNSHTHAFYRWINELPLALLVAIVILVVLKPF